MPPSPLYQAPAFRHPGRAFIEAEGLPERGGPLLDYLERYVRFLRSSSGTLGAQTPNLMMILLAFGLRGSRGMLGDRQRGFLVANAGYIVVNIRDSPERQRYTIAHELVELLFEALRHEGYAFSTYARRHDLPKERLCETGAAMLLMPRASVLRMTEGERPCFSLASRMSSLFGVSFTAALIRMVSLWQEAPLTLAVWQAIHIEEDASLKDSPAESPQAPHLLWQVHAHMRCRTLARLAVLPAPLTRTLDEGTPFLETISLRAGTSAEERYRVEARRYQTGAMRRLYALFACSAS